MAVTFAVEPLPQSVGSRTGAVMRAQTGTNATLVAGLLTLDSSYPSGGYTSALGFNPNLFGLDVITNFLPCQVVTTSTGFPTHQAVYNRTTLKLMIFTLAATPAEASGDLSTKSLDVCVIGY